MVARTLVGVGAVVAVAAGAVLVVRRRKAVKVEAAAPVAQPLSLKAALDAAWAAQDAAKARRDAAWAAEQAAYARYKALPFDVESVEWQASFAEWQAANAAACQAIHDHTATIRATNVALDAAWAREGLPASAA